jgi:hypothetical protein
VASAGNEVEGLAVRYLPEEDKYVATGLEWIVDEDGKAIPGTLNEYLVEYISTDAEKDEAYLPVIRRVGSAARLRRGMFQSPLGPKEL